MSSYAHERVAELRRALDSVAQESAFERDLSSFGESDVFKAVQFIDKAKFAPLDRQGLTKVSECIEGATSLSGAPQVLALGSAIVSSYGILQSELLAAAERQGSCDWYWAGIEQSWSRLILYLVQTFPHRIFSTLKSGSWSKLALEKVLMGKKSFVSNPLIAARQEISEKRKSISNSKRRIGEKLGLIAGLMDHNVPKYVSSSYMHVTVGFGRLIDCSVEPRELELDLMHSAETMLSVLEEGEGSGSDDLISLSQRLVARLKDIKVEDPEIPCALTRWWPFLVFAPFAICYGADLILKERASIVEFYKNAWDTAGGFVREWIFEPVVDILRSMKNKQHSLSLVSRDALHSELESLQRMVVNLMEDRYALSPSELARINEEVGRGNMTAFQKEYESEIKSPFRSTMTGSLIRTMLILTQKIKVDLTMALSGMQQVLQSQELTIAFVGITPSLFIVWLVRTFVSSIFSGAQSIYTSRDALRHLLWRKVRSIDAMLLHPHASADVTSPEESRGLVIIELQTLRQYAASGAFPLRDEQVVAEFLDDVRCLEDLPFVEDNELFTKAATYALARIWKWAHFLGWDSL